MSFHPSFYLAGVIVIWKSIFLVIAMLAIMDVTYPMTVGLMVAFIFGTVVHAVAFVLSVIPCGKPADGRSAHAFLPFITVCLLCEALLTLVSIVWQAKNDDVGDISFVKPAGNPAPFLTYCGLLLSTFILNTVNVGQWIYAYRYMSDMSIMENAKQS